jgi:hypothetical protein
MPTRKQRRRREKTFRHDYDFVVLDEEGREVEVDPAELRKAKEKERPKPQQAAATARGRTAARGGREIQPPSWRRVGKRAAIFLPLMFVAVSVLDKKLSVEAHALQTAFLLAFFLPFSYVMDTIAYRMYQKRTGRTAPPRDGQASRRWLR